MERLGCPPVDFLKIDVEGFEAQVMAGAGRLLRNVSPLVMFEISGQRDRLAELAPRLDALGYAIYRLLKDTSVNIYLTVFLATALADMFTYVTTSLELALAYPAAVGGFGTSFVMFLAIFAITQVPLAIVEGIVLALVFKYIVALKPDILIRMKVFTEAQINAARGEA